MNQQTNRADWPLWEVFIRSQHGLAHKHVGSLHAVEPSPTLIAQLEGNVRQKPARGLFAHQA